MRIKFRVALLALTVSFAAMSAPALAAPPSKTLRDLVKSIGGDPSQAGSARYAYLNKLDGNLQSLAAHEKPVSVDGVTLTGPAAVSGGKTLVDVYVNGDIAAAAQQLRALGMDVQAVSRHNPERMVEGLLPISAATKVAALSATKGVLSGVAGGTNTGAVTSQGDASQRGPQARALGANGAGITVGVMSDSINDVGSGISGSQTSGDLPANVTDLGDAGSGSDEGRAMAEIVYDEAPGITHMLFDTGTTGAAAKASHIAALVSGGARVIADDTFYMTEPFFQDGGVAQAVDAAKAAGTAYIASAGNRANQSWNGTFTDAGGGFNDFGGGDTRQAVVDQPANRSSSYTLQWDDPWGAKTNAFNMTFYADNVLIGSCAPNATAFPIQQCTITTGASAHEIEMEITRLSGTGNPRMKYIVATNFGTFSVKEHATNQGAIDPDAASANGSLTTAAVCWSTLIGNCIGAAGLQSPEGFSSRGPTMRTRDASGNPLAAPDVRAKPNVAGADGVSTDLSGGSGLNPFFGTSAAAPSVAGVAALALSANPAMNVNQLYALLTNPANSLDCVSAAGQPDNDCGAGFIQADRVVTGAKTRPTVAAALTPATPNGANGFYRSPVTVAWNIGDPNPSALITTGCSPTTVSSDTIGSTFTCSANGAGGTASGSVTVKLDTTPPSKPKFSGISAKAYKRSKLPKLSKIKCSATDPTSGVQSCKVRGFKKTKGPHKLTATATNGAGETKKSTLTYGVNPLCKVPKLKGKSLDAAKRALTRSRCKLGKTTPNHPSGGATVRSSSPKAGTLLRAGAKVKLRLG
jgi:subtilisin family serine protease